MSSRRSGLPKLAAVLGPGNSRGYYRWRESKRTDPESLVSGVL